MTRKEEFLKFLNTCSDKTLAMVFHLCRRYMPENLDKWAETANDDFIAGVVAELNGVIPDCDNLGKLEQIFMGGKFWGVFKSVFEAVKSPVVQSAVRGDYIFATDTRTNWVLGDHGWVDSGLKIEEEKEFQTTCTLYFNFHTCYWDADKPDEDYRNREDYSYMKKGTRLLFKYEENNGVVKYVGRLRSRDKVRIEFSSEEAMLASGWFEEVCNEGIK